MRQKSETQAWWKMQLIETDSKWAQISYLGDRDLKISIINIFKELKSFQRIKRKCGINK